MFLNEIMTITESWFLNLKERMSQKQRQQREVKKNDLKN